jgi:hypothetical protein
MGALETGEPRSIQLCTYAYNQTVASQAKCTGVESQQRPQNLSWQARRIEVPVPDQHAERPGSQQLPVAVGNARRDRTVRPEGVPIQDRPAAAWNPGLGR